MIAADGQVIGEVAALFLDGDTWRVESLQVKLRKEIADQIGANRSIFHAGTLEIPTHMIQSAGDTVILSVPVEGLRQVLPKDAKDQPTATEETPEVSPGVDLPPAMPHARAAGRGGRAPKGSHRSA